MLEKAATLSINDTFEIFLSLSNICPTSFKNIILIFLKHFNRENPRYYSAHHLYEPRQNEQWIL